jgi:hypothetical protein
VTTPLPRGNNGGNGAAVAQPLFLEATTVATGQQWLRLSPVRPPSSIKDHTARTGGTAPDSMGSKDIMGGQTSGAGSTMGDDDEEQPSKRQRLDEGADGGGQSSTPELPLPDESSVPQPQPAAAAAAAAPLLPMPSAPPNAAAPAMYAVEPHEEALLLRGRLHAHIDTGYVVQFQRHRRREDVCSCVFSSI